MKKCDTCFKRDFCISLCQENQKYVEQDTKGQAELVSSVENYVDRFSFDKIDEINPTTLVYVAKLYWSHKKTPIEIEAETGFDLSQVISFISIVQNSIEYFLDKVTLSQRVKMIVRLHFYERKSAREISESLGISNLNVYEYLTRFVNSVGRLETEKRVIFTLLNDVKNKI